MNNKFTAFLRRIIGRLKEYMSASFLALGIFAMTSALYLKIEGQDAKNAMILVIMGIIAFSFSVYWQTKEDKEANAKFKAQLNVAIDQMIKTDKSFNDLLDEIKELRKDFTKLSSELKQEKPEIIHGVTPRNSPKSQRGEK